jgi:N-methylhydantoinase A
VLMEEGAGKIHLMKLPSTPSDPSHGYLDVVQRILKTTAFPADVVHYNTHGTTVPTNTSLSGWARGAAAPTPVRRATERDRHKPASRTRSEAQDLLRQEKESAVGVARRGKRVAFEIHS